MASPVPACVSAVFPEALARTTWFVESPKFNNANNNVPRDTFYKGFVAPLLALFQCHRPAALQIADNFEALALDKIDKYVSLQMRLQDTRLEHIFDAASDLKLRDSLTRHDIPLEEKWKQYCKNMKG
eukprot:4667885-Pleurochrysis_carterae.AAC.2